MTELKADARERRVLEVLDAVVRREAVAPLLDSIAARLDGALAKDGRAAMAWEVVPLSAYGGGLPAEIRSSWVFILRARVATGAERHPNSRQRMMSYRGAGNFPVWDGAAWRPNHLISDRAAPLEKRWLSIPVNAWHQSSGPEVDWVVVSFHTAAEDELIEERGDPAAPSVVTARRYLDEGAAEGL
jgi:hypothetical protein